MATFDSLLSTARSAVNDHVTNINRLTRELEELRGQSAPDATRLAALRSAKAEAEDALPRLQRDVTRLEEERADDAQLTRAAQDSHPAAERVERGYTSERSRVYTERNTNEFMRDLYQFSFGGVSLEGQARLQRHEREAREAGQLSERAVSTTTLVGIVPPQYLVDEFALVARAGRPTASVAKSLPLPAEGMSLIIPKGTTGATTAVQATENSAVSNTDEAWANVTVPVVTVAGQQDVSRQSIERAQGVDQIVFGDLAMDYALKLNQQVLSGTGSSGQALGILQTAGIGQATAFTAAVTLATFYSKIAGQINGVQTTRFLAPDVIIMHPRRWNWLISQLDTTNRPLITPEGNGPTNAYGVSTVPVDTGSIQAVGRLAGLPVITDASVPISVGSGPEDQVIIARSKDLLLWEEGDGSPSTLRFEQTLGNQLTVKLVAYGYAAFTAARYPTAVGLIGGNSASTFGLTTPVF
jgi:HK97 family phage major capsid protein